MVSPCCSFVFDWLIIKVAGKQDKHKSLVEFDFGPNQTTHFGVTCPWVTKISHFWTWISLKPVGQSWSNFMCSIIGIGKGCIRFWGRLDQNSDRHGNRKPPHSFLIESSSKLLVTRTGIKAWRKSISGHWFPWPIYMFFEMKFDLGTLDSGERSLPFGLLVFLFPPNFSSSNPELSLQSEHTGAVRQHCKSWKIDWFRRPTTTIIIIIIDILSALSTYRSCSG